ncbi:Small-conductance mechanosensitive channel [Posidoniimonas polymericola]|uniref:Small-conductance mechanosensitive channel n=1 Tax=Posidoniimonas polymericola TaxID=2528002 RepID=A0A5C5ZE50_9BACT|nr:mechanosensitive ion channel domain-containing protein [Posidoniimonas polymericola]TWT85426.1 Small-conductance mechanosensitive channel [Posidoniimonas polymericola]
MLSLLLAQAQQPPVQQPAAQTVQAGTTPPAASAVDAAAAAAAGGEKLMTPPPGLSPQTYTDLMKLNWGALDAGEWKDIAAYYLVQWGARIGLALIVFYIAWTLAGWLSMLVDRALGRLRFDVTLTKFLSRLARWLVLLLAGLMSLSYFGVETTSFAALIGAAGLAVGLAFQGTLSNFAAGAMLLLFRPFKVGDAVNVAGQLGVIDEISIFTTSMDTFDHKRIIIPNGEIFGSVIENITYHSYRRVDGDVGVSYSADIDQTRAVLEQVAAGIEGVYPGKDPAVVLQGLGASSVDWTVRVWAPTADFLALKQQLLRDIKVALDREGIEIPFPQLDVHIDQAGAA